MDINYSVCFLLSFKCLSGGAPAMEERKKTRENPEKEERR